MHGPEEFAKAELPQPVTGKHKLPDRDIPGGKLTQTERNGTGKMSHRNHPHRQLTEPKRYPDRQLSDRDKAEAGMTIDSSNAIIPDFPNKSLKKYKILIV